MWFREFLKRNFLTRNLYSKLRHIKYKRINKRKRKNMSKHGIETIKFLQDFLSEAGYTFFFDMGTLLGIIREGNLLKHDLDIDIAIFIKSEEEKNQLTQKLTDNHCKLKYKYTVEDIGIVEQSFERNGIKFDFNFYYTQGDKNICYLLYYDPAKEYERNVMDVVKLECKSIDSIINREFFGGNINIPANAEAYLACRYGENWRVPDTSYVYWKGPSASKIANMGEKKVY